MFARVYSAGLLGVDAYRIEVEVDCAAGMGQIHIVGLPGAAVQESAQRVRAAIKACDFILAPGHKWIVNLAPGDLRKEGPIYDLPIAAGILISSNTVTSVDLGRFWMVGELGLNGSVRPVAGVLSIALACKQSGAGAIIIPEANLPEAALINGLSVYPVSHLRQVCSILSNPQSMPPVTDELRQYHCAGQLHTGFAEDYCEVRGQMRAKRALEITAAGRHNILLVGPPGAGKSMLAQRLPGIMPPLEFDEALDLTKLYSAAGKLKDKCRLIAQRPFRAPHHTASESGLIGGGNFPRPGEVSLSHHGILFLDELTEFPRRHLETLRQPLETGLVTISRSQHTLSYPASFLLVGACNPCPCGHRGDYAKLCTCTPYQADRYWSRLSGPLLDRIDLHVETHRPTEDDLAGLTPSERSESIKLRVMRAVVAQQLRTGGGPTVYNSHLSGKQLLIHCKIDGTTRQRLANAIANLGLSARSFDKTLRIARTIADLQGQNEITWDQIVEALDYRFRAIGARGQPQAPGAFLRACRSRDQDAAAQ